MPRWRCGAGGSRWWQWPCLATGPVPGLEFEDSIPVAFRGTKRVVRYLEASARKGRGSRRNGSGMFASFAAMRAPGSPSLLRTVFRRQIVWWCDRGFPASGDFRRSRDGRRVTHAAFLRGTTVILDACPAGPAVLVVGVAGCGRRADGACTSPAEACTGGRPSGQGRRVASRPLRLVLVVGCLCVFGEWGCETPVRAGAC